MLSTVSEETKSSFGQRLADATVHLFSGWPFVVFLGISITIWVVFNTKMVTAPDPYPYILLNLILSFLAAFENNVILMSSRRLERLDREIAQRNLQLSISSDEMLKEAVELLEKDQKFNSEFMTEIIHFAQHAGIDLDGCKDKHD